MEIMNNTLAPIAYNRGHYVCAFSAFSAVQYRMASGDTAAVYLYVYIVRSYIIYLYTECFTKCPQLHCFHLTMTLFKLKFLEFLKILLKIIFLNS